MADGAGMAGAPLDVSGRKPGAAGGIHAVDSDAAVVVDAVHAAQGVRVVDSSGLNHILPVEAGQTLAQTIWLSGELSPPALCSGLGRCGACRVRFFEGTPEPCDADSAILGAEAVRGGWRLACRHAAVAGMVVELPPPPSGKRKRMDIRPDAGPFRLAVDLGTTSIHWRLLDGTGYLSLLDALLRTGFLDATGRLASAPVSPLAARLLGTVERGAAGWSLPLPGGMELAGADVEEILKVKAAFSLALESLLAASGLESRALARVCLGGALGEHMPETALERLGFLPQGLQTRTVAEGNTSLRGAALLLTRPELRERLVRWSSGCTLVDLAARPDFTALYMRHMVFG